MRVLLDEQLPRHLAWQLVGQDVYTVQQQQWAGLTNSDLLAEAAAARFDAVLTADQSLALQENLNGSPLRIVLVHDLTSAVEDLLPLVPAMLAAIETATPGEVIRVPKREHGVVSSFSEREGHGEIRSDETGDLVLVHFSQIQGEGFLALAAGDRVEFTRVEMPERPYAWDVVKKQS